VAEFLSLVLSGAVAGALYAILASGLVLTYQTSGIFNVGHGAIAFTSALTYHLLHQPSEAGGLGWPIVPSAVMAVLVVAPLLGIGLDAALFRRLSHAPETARLVGAIGLLVALPAAVLLLVDAANTLLGAEFPAVEGEAGLSPPGIGPSPPIGWSLAEGVAVSSDEVAVLVAAAACAAGLWFLLQHTRLGLETRAGVDRPTLARLRGIDTDRSSRIVWALTALLAGLAGVLIAPLFDLAPITLHMVVFTSFTAAVAARLRSVPVAFAAGLALGVVANLVAGYAPESLTEISGFRSAVPFMVMFVLLFFVPSTGRHAGTVAEDAPPLDPRADLSPGRRRMPWVVAAVVLVGYVWFLADPYWNGIVNRGLVLALVFLSFVVVTGVGGMINLAQAAFVTTGGFVAGWLVNHQWPSTIPILMDNGRLPFWVAMVVATVVAAAVGLLVALPSLRLGGLTLALATLALAFVGDRLVFQLEGVRNGSRGWSIPKPAYGPVDLGDPKVLATVLLVLVVVVVGVVGNLTRSATGRAVLAVRSSEVAAATAGVDPVRTKLVLFAVSAGLAGFAGAWFALVNSPMTNASAPPLLGLVWLAVAVTFGIRRPGGAVVAGLVYAALPVVLTGIGANWEGVPWSWLPDSAGHLIASPELAAMLFGLGAVGLAREPDGVLAEVGNATRARRQARAVRRSGEGSIEAAPDAPVVAPRPVDAGLARGGSAAADAALARGTSAAPDVSAGGPDTTVRRTGATGLPAEWAGAGDELVLELRDIHAGYRGVEVLHGVDLVVPRGGVVAVVGANGAGKSTLCAVAAGTLVATRGQVVLDGIDRTQAPPHERARAGVVLAPEARGIFPGLTVDDNLAVRLRRPEAREAARRRFPILAERGQQAAGLLSGGEQQQLAMAVALADPPRVFLADEPSLGLAPMAVRTVFEALAELRDRGCSLVLVEEQAGAALALADWVVIMELGRVSWAGPASEVDLDRLTASYLGG
jgi:branched-subunit amino acid ABC-type transport system permease component/ABC-type branched-subunit amino acid transport system ATPase component